MQMFPGTKNRNKGTFAKAALLRNQPFVSSRYLGIANGGVPRRGFSNSWTCCVFFAWKSVIAREFLLKIDTLLAIATSGLRTNLLFENPPSENPHSIFPRYSARFRKIARAFGRKIPKHCKLNHKESEGKCKQDTNACVSESLRSVPVRKKSSPSQSWVPHGIATTIASDFLNRRRNRKGFPQGEANFGQFSSQNASQPQPYRYRKKSPSRIWISPWAPLAVIQYRWPYN